MTRGVHLRAGTLVAILLIVGIQPAYAIQEAISELRERLEAAPNTEAVMGIAEEIISRGERTIEEFKDQIHILQAEKAELQRVQEELKSEKAELQRVQTALTSGLIGAFVTAIVAISGILFRVMNSRVDRDLKRLEVVEKISKLHTEGVSIPVDISRSYEGSAPSTGSGTEDP